MTMRTLLLSAATLTLLAACNPRPAVNPQADFFAAFEPFCGQSFAAEIVEDNAPSDAWDHPLVVHIRDCEEDVIRMPLHVGEDRSRTWVLTKHDDYIDFQHIHLHEDGSPDAVSPYGGQTLTAGTAQMQSFPVDEASKALFMENGLDVSVTNTWTIEFVDAETMAYELRRPGRIFRVHVDLSQPIDEPPPAWGYKGE
ncbi:hypothetical protein C9927_01325 [Pseudidiomarina aestuarii]|uniref:Uncharacterized protein n=1 Tax=Pseudidiomarina aestuarii TaxID=624146 RepID=A0A2T4D8D1_9GAMM|nr:hypothetical protein C9927_01325 [Pseudidiomarina aestuarii]PTB90069.1 hypothetical protein C9928_01415 [Pseudidiomarina aestuarii]